MNPMWGPVELEPEVRDPSSRSENPRADDRALARADSRLARGDVTNVPTERAHNLIKRIKRVGFGFGNFAYCRIRVLLHTVKPQLSAAGDDQTPLESQPVPFVSIPYGKRLTRLNSPGTRPSGSRCSAFTRPNGRPAQGSVQ